MRFKNGLEKELGRKGQGPIGVQDYVYDLRCAYLTAKKWQSAAHEMQYIDLDKTWRLLSSVYGIPDDEIWELKLKDIFENPAEANGQG